MKRITRWKRMLALICAALLLSSVMPSPIPVRAVENQLDQEKEENSKEEAAVETQEIVTPNAAVTEETQKTAVQENSVTGKEQDESVQEKITEEPAVYTGEDDQNEDVEIVYPEEITGLSDLELETGEKSDLMVSIVPDSLQDVQVRWNSSAEDVAQVAVDPTDSTKAVVTALTAGKAVITASVDGKDGAVETSCNIKVKGEPESVAIRLEDGLDADNILATQGSFNLKAELTPAAEYCIDSTVYWNIAEGQQYVELNDNTVTIKDLDQDEVTVKFSVKTTNGKNDEISVTLKKADSVVTVNDSMFAYGDEGKKLTASVNGADKTEKVTFSLTDGGDVADVTSDGSVTIKKTGTFKVKASFDGDGTYKNAESEEKTFTVQPKTLQVVLADITTAITKESDGTTALIDENKKEIENRIKIADGQLVPGDLLSLSVEIPDTVSYTTTKLGLANSIKLKDVVIGMETENENYVLDTAPVTNASIPAQITANNSTDDLIDMTVSAGDAVLENNGVNFKAGTKGRSGDYWYDGNGVPVVLPAGTSVEDFSGNTLVKDGFFTAGSEDEFYVNQNEIYYGPYTVKYQKDITAPEITLKSVKVNGKDQEGLVFDKTVIYTIEVKDTESGVKEKGQEGILYGIASEDNISKVTTWQEPSSLTEDGDTYTFQVEVEGNGYLFVKATDLVENNSCSDRIRAIVLESQKPEISVSVDKTSYEQKHTVTVTTSDAEEAGTSPYTYSGIAKIVYELKQEENLVYENTVVNPVSPETLEDLPKTRIFNDEITDLQKGNRGVYADQLLDGSFELTVTVYDNCGNFDSSSCTLNFDNTAPEYTVKMTDGRTDSQGTYYYREDNCGVTITVSDARLEDGVTYEAAVGNIVKNDILTTDGIISFGQDEVAALEDGICTIKVIVTDAAGNQNTKYLEISGINGTEDQESASFVLDKTAPVVTAVQTSGEAKGPYDGQDYYYNEENLKTVFTIEEVNAESNQWTASIQKDGQKVNTYSIDSNQVVFDLSADGKYTDITVSGQDLAGNPLVIAQDVSLTSNEADAIMAEGNEPGQNGVVTMQNNKVTDHIAPIAVIKYTTAESDHIYTDDADGRTAAAYYNTDIETAITVTDKYGDIDVSLDASKLFFGDTGMVSAAGDASSDTTAQITYVWSQDGRYYVTVYGTDRAGNALTVKEEIPDQSGSYVTSEAQKDDYQAKYLLIRDTKAPEYRLTISSDAAARQNKNEQGNRYYFNAGFVATVTVDETNYDGDRIYVRRAEESADNRKDSQLVQLSDDFSKRIESDSRVYTDTVEAGDGTYRYQIYGTDRAGNALVPAADVLNKTNLSDEKQKVTEKEFTFAEQQDQETEADLSVHVVVDTVNPELDIRVNEDGGENFYIAKLTKEGAYEQSKNLPYRSKSKASALIKGTDYSPISLAYKMESSNSKADNRNTDYPGTNYIKDDSQIIALNGQQTVRIADLTVTDLAGNTSTAAKSYNGAVSTWMYLDVEPPTYDELAPNVTMSLSGNTEGKAKGSVYGPDGNALYTSNVTAEVHVEDPNKDIKASGLYHVYYKVEVNGADWTNRGLVDVSSRTDSGIIPVITNGMLAYRTAGAGKEVEKNETLTYDDRITFRFNSSDFNYNDVKLTVWAEDNSGNVIQTSNRVSRGFGIDITDPTIRVSYDNNDVRNERYFNADRTATIVVTERNFDESRTPIDTQDAARISGWTHEKGNAANGDDDTWTCTVSYQTDGDYTFDVKTTDLAGNSMAGNVDYGNSAVPTDFTVDKTLPVINITFDNDDVRNGKYYNASRTATVEVNEHNFSGDGAVVTVTANIAEGSVSAPGITGWSSGNDRNVTTIPFTADGDYTLQVEYTDLAGNVAEMKTVDEFTVDTTAPVIEIGGVEENSANQGEVAPSITYHDINYDAAGTSVSIVGYKNVDGKNLNGSAQENAFGGSFICTNIEEIPENDDVYLCTGHVEDLAGNSSEAELRFSVNRFGSNYILDESTEKLVGDYYTNQAPELHITEINVNSLQFKEITATLNGEIMNLQEGTDYQVEEVGNENTWKEYHYTISSKFFQQDGAYNITVHSRDLAENENSNRTAQVEEYSKPVDFVLDTTNPEVIISGVEQDAQYVEDSRTVTLLTEDNIKLKEVNVYMDDQLVDSYDEDALVQAAGTVTYQAVSKNDWQILRVVATDKAGNQSEQQVRFLLTSNLWIQYIHNTPLLIGTGVGAVVLIGLLILLGKKRREKENGETEA